MRTAAYERALVTSNSYRDWLLHIDNFIFSAQSRARMWERFDLDGAMTEMSMAASRMHR